MYNFIGSFNILLLHKTALQTAAKSHLYFLQIYYLPLPFKTIFKKKDEETFYLAEMEAKKSERISRLISKKCDELGKWSFREICVANIFLILVLLWFFRFVPSQNDCTLLSNSHSSNYFNVSKDGNHLFYYFF